MVRVIELYATAEPGTFARSICEQIIDPNIDRINKQLGQDSDPLYLAYLTEYACVRAYKPTQNKGAEHDTKAKAQSSD